MSHPDNRGKNPGSIANRRRILQAIGGVGIAGMSGISVAQDGGDDNVIELEGESLGWTGVSPSDIEGETNPTISLVSGEEYTLEWTNTDGAGHNFAIVDADGDEILASEIITGEGSTQTVEFTATEEMAEYLCQPHPNSMVGELDIGDEPDPGPGPDPEPDSDWTKRRLTDVDNAMKMDIASDGRIFYTTRGEFFGEGEEGVGEVSVVDPDTEAVSTALELETFTDEEDGLQGITLDPEFEDTGWVYLFYSPRAEDLDPVPVTEIKGFSDQGRRRVPPEHSQANGNSNGRTAPPEHAQGEPPWLEEGPTVEPVVPDGPYIQLSRFTMDDEYTIDPDSEVGILTVPVQRETCCHVGGDLAFDASGNLYLSTGDDTNPFETDGYAPIDERDGNEYIDAQRTSANTADLRGKILRITPHEDGSYSIPEGNLFPVDEYGAEIEDGLVRPEIYVMGLRNPFTIEVDRESDTLYFADYGEGAAEWSTERGAIGLVQQYRTQEPQNAGWPYFIGPNYPYIDYDYETGVAGEPFDPDNPINDSPNNTGLEELPPAYPATLWYPLSWDNYLDSPDYVDLARGPGEIPWPDLPDGSGAPMTGPVYRYDDAFGETAPPEEYDGKHVIADWLDNWLRVVSYDDDGDDHDIEEFAPNHEFASPMDLEFGPDGTLYVLEYGSGYDGGGGGVYRIEYDP